jgi:hypothetical protein
MADVTVNIRGNASQLQRELENAGRSAENVSTSGTTSVSSNVSQAQFDFSAGRITELVRATLTANQSYSARQAIDVVRAQETLGIESYIDAKGGRLHDLANERFARHQDQDRLYKEHDDIDARMAVEEKELTQRLVDSLDNLTKGVSGLSYTKDGADSYIGNLRSMRQRALLERETAKDKENADAAQNKINEIDQELRGAGSPRNNRGQVVYDPTQMLMSAGGQLMSGIQGGDLSGVVGGVGTSAVALFSSTLQTAMRRIVYVEVARQAASFMSNINDTSTQAAMGIGRYRSTVGGLTGEQSRQAAMAGMSGVDIGELGFDYNTFINRTQAGIQARGSGNDWFERTRRDVSIERATGLNEGALIGAGQFDRYQRNNRGADYYWVQLLGMLEQIEGSGVKINDYTRASEKFDIQQAFLDSWRQINGSPSAQAANQWTAAFSGIQGIAQDSRQGEYARSMQSALTNPTNDRARAFLYNTVAEMSPEATQGGRTHLIDQMLYDPEQQGKILQRFAQNFTNTFGDMDSEQGYWSARSMFPGIPPDQLKAILKELSDPNSDPAQVLAGYKDIMGISDTEIRRRTDEYQQQASEFFTDTQRTLKEISQGFKDFASRMFGGQGRDETINSWRNATKLNPLMFVSPIGGVLNNIYEGTHP